MRFFDSLEAVPKGFGPSAVTIGKFDGVHTGHRAVIADLREVAAERGIMSVVVTFDRNPLQLLAPERCPEALISNEQKVELLASTGVDATLMLTFDRALAEQPPAQFVTDVLVGALGAKSVSVGADFRFGKGGEGDVELLRTLGAEYGFDVELIPEVDARDRGADRRASSTWVRELLEAGEVEKATDLLGRPPSIRATIVPGEQRGRDLGYPTANLSRDHEGLIPRDGVYAAWAMIEGRRYGAAVSVGNNPTFEGVPQKQVEAHLLDVRGDFYGKVIDLAFVEYVRPMNAFESVDLLVAQMRRDEQRIRHTLGFPPAAPADR